MIHSGKQFVACFWVSFVLANISTAFNHNDLTTTMNALEKAEFLTTRISYNWLRFINKQIQKLRTFVQTSQLNIGLVDSCARCLTFLGCQVTIWRTTTTDECKNSFPYSFPFCTSSAKKSPTEKQRNAETWETRRQVQGTENHNQFLFRSNEFETMEGERKRGIRFL